MYSCGKSKVDSWSIPNKELKYEFQCGTVYDIVIGREGTPLANRMISVGAYSSCRISNLETGAEVKTINFDSKCRSIAVDKTQTLIAVGTENNVTFIETTNFTKVREVALNRVYSLAFNKRNDCMLAVLNNGGIHSFKF